MSDSIGQSLELFFVDGRPDGLLTAELFNWTGHVLIAPRTQLTTVLGRKEAHYTGVYILLGENDDGDLAYIGESEDLGNRIKNHDTTKDWWNSAVLVSASGNRLNKAHVKYLESRLVEEARRQNKVALENGNTPARPDLSEPDQSKMEAFLNNLFMVLPAIRVDCFLQSTRPQSITMVQ